MRADHNLGFSKKDLGVDAAFAPSRLLGTAKKRGERALKFTVKYERCGGKHEESMAKNRHVINLRKSVANTCHCPSPQRYLI